MTGRSDWPVEVTGITETVVATPRPSGPWNLAALGLRSGDAVTARTWGRTRTRRNFERSGEGIVQFVDDPRTFAEAAVGILERDTPIHPSAAAWVRVDVEVAGRGSEADTEWVEWALEPRDARVRRRTVPIVNRGYGAVIEATVAASRLDVPAYDRQSLRERLDSLDRIVRRCGGPREREAMDRIAELVPWTPESDERAPDVEGTDRT